MINIKKFQDYIDKNSLEKKEHQKICVKWCLKREIYGSLCDKKIIKGGLIADEMGLGKTIQMIGTMVCNKKRTLIVVPRCLLEQWSKFIKKTTDFSVLIFHGKDRERNINFIQENDVVITTYNLIEINKINKIKELHEIEWERVIFDEAHHMRNNNTNIFRGANKLKSQIRWLLTGTPIQNSKKDFYSLCEQIGIHNKYYTNPNYLHNIVNNFILKRTKKEINLDLPEINKIDIAVAWETEEEEMLAKEIHSILNFSKIQVSPLHIANKLGNGILPLMMRAKQSCIYPPMLKNKIEEIIMSDEIIEKESMRELLEKATHNTSKLNKVIEKILERKENGNKKIIFCTFRAEIDYLENKLSNRDMIIEKFDGRTKEKDRIEILENNNIDILILQIQTGSEGLNLQIFNEIYFVSSHWNPSIEDQAIARAHRIGQKKEIYIFKFTMNSFDNEDENISIEKYTQNIQESKRELINIINKI